ncbi:MAG: hypothetical protein INR69_10680 [Mucilaginibacter polytrichastri]|nr:hypothetical protein [Mucilaginibacter polytrichastri]
MKWTFITLLTLGLSSCNNSTDKNPVDNETAKDSLVHIDTFNIDQNEVGSNEYKEFYTCNFDKVVNNPKTPKLAKDIYLDKDWNLNNDTEALALLDSLAAKDKSARPFYFKVVTKTEKKSDGYFSEGLGLAGYDFVENHTQEFASYFDNKQCHTDNDLATWADILILELGIIGEGNYDKQIAEDYINKLRLNCKGCSTEQIETINKFGLTLKEKWSEFLKQID